MITPLAPTLSDRIAARRAGLFRLDPRFGDAVFAGLGGHAIVPTRSRAAQFTAANSESLTSPWSADYSAGFTVAVWVKVNRITDSDAVVFNTGDRSVEVQCISNTARILVKSGDAFYATSLGQSFSVDWHLWIASYDPASQVLRIDVDQLTASTSSVPTPNESIDTTLHIGGLAGFAFRTLAIGPMAFWSRPITDGERTALYNNGVGKQYADLSDSEKVGLVSFWDLKEESDGTTAVTRNDSHGTNHLADNNTCPSTAHGLIRDASDYFHDSSLYNNHGTLEPDAATGPQWEWSEELGRWGLEFDGNNDYVETLAGIAPNNDFTWCSWAYIRAPFRDDLFTWKSADGTQDIGMYIGDAATPYAQKLVAYFNAVVAQSADDVQINTWVHLAIRRLGTSVQCYIGGEPNGTAGSSSAGVSGYQRRLWLGSNHSGFFALSAFNHDGFIADPLIFPRALSAAEIALLADPSFHPIVPLRERWRSWLDLSPVRGWRSRVVGSMGRRVQTIGSDGARRDTVGSAGRRSLVYGREE